LAQIPDGEAK